MRRKALAVAALSVLALGPCLARADDPADGTGIPHYVFGKHEVNDTSETEGTVMTRVLTIEAAGVVGHAGEPTREPIDLRATLRIKTDGATLLNAVVHLTQTQWPNTVTVKGSVAPLFSELVNDPKFTPEQFGGEVVEVLIGLLKEANWIPTPPCNIHFLTRFFTAAGAQAAIGFAKTGGLE